MSTDAAAAAAAAAAASPAARPAGAAPATPAGRRGRSQPTLKLLGIGLLLAWVAFWFNSFADFRFATDLTWVSPWQFLGLDLAHCIFAVRVMFDGQNPYLVDTGDFRGAFTAPPMVLPLFAWTRLFDPYWATVIWAAAIAAGIGWAVVLCRRVRAALGLWVPNLPLALAAMLWSMPVLFSMERGNLDVWVLITLLLALACLRRRGWGWEALAGLALAVGAWAKIYPGLLVPALLPFGRWRAALVAAIGIVLIGVVPLNATRQFFQNASKLEEENRVAPIKQVADWLRNPRFEAIPKPHVGKVEAYNHSLITFWPLLFRHTPFASVPGFLGAAAVFGPLLLYVTWQVYRSHRRDRLMLPYLLWVLAIGTYGLPISFDYNLFFLLLAALSLWDVRDGVIVHLLMLLVVLWWQPVALPIGVMSFIYMKFLAIVPVTVLLVKRAREGGEGATPGFDVAPRRDDARTPGRHPRDVSVVTRT